MRHTFLIVAILLLVAVPVLGAPSFLGGFSGNILTPDGLILPTGGWQASFHQFNDFLIFNRDLTAVGLGYGLAQDLEVGASFFNNDGSDVAFHGKYRLVPDTAQRPVVIVGALDAFGTADDLDGDPGFYLLLSKNLGPTPIDVGPNPFRLTVGFGSGFLDGFFAAAEWIPTDQLSLMVEFTNANVTGGGNIVDIGARYAIAPNFRVDLGLVDVSDLVFGASYTSGF